MKGYVSEVYARTGARNRVTLTLAVREHRAFCAPLAPIKLLLLHYISHRGGAKEFVRISGAEFAADMERAQRRVEGYLLVLDRRGYIERLRSDGWEKGKGKGGAPGYRLTELGRKEIRKHTGLTALVRAASARAQTAGA